MVNLQADSSQVLMLGRDSGLFHLYIDVDKAGIGHKANMAMWGYQLQFMSNKDSGLLHTLTIPQYTFGRGIRK